MGASLTLIRWTQPSGPLCFWQCLSLTHWYCLSVIVSFCLSSSKFIYRSTGGWSGWSSKVICFLGAPSVLNRAQVWRETFPMATQCGEGPALFTIYCVFHSAKPYLQCSGGCVFLLDSNNCHGVHLHQVLFTFCICVQLHFMWLMCSCVHFRPGFTWRRWSWRVCTRPSTWCPAWLLLRCWYNMYNGEVFGCNCMSQKIITFSIWPVSRSVTWCFQNFLTSQHSLWLMCN